MSKKAVIISGGKQYLVAEGEQVTVELLKTDLPAGQAGKKTVNFEPLLVIDDKKISVGRPALSGIEIKATVLEQDIKQDKVTAIRYKAKKRVRKVRGHRQRQTILKVDKITAK